jgi:hypothetical protein
LSDDPISIALARLETQWRSLKELAQRQARLPEAVRDKIGYVGLPEAAALVGRSDETIRLWVRADPTLGLKAAGEWLVDGDLLIAHVAAKSKKRPM